MARDISKVGQFNFTGNFEVKVQRPLDSRMVVETISELTDSNYWGVDGDTNVYLYKGIAVSVWNDDPGNNGIYILTDDNYTDIDNWLKVSGSGDLNLEDSVTIGFTQSVDGTYSAFIKPDSITVSNLKTVDGFATASYLLSNDGLGNFKWVEPIPSAGSITMEDYNTGQSFNNVQNIIIRGGVITVPTGTATGGLASETAPNTVTVWIPAPNYANSFQPSLAVSTTPRYVSKPTVNVDLGLTQGYFGTGNWVSQTDFDSNTTRPVTNVGNIPSAFSTPNFFNCYGPNGDGVGTTMSFRVFDSQGNVIGSIDNFIIDSGANQTSGPLTIIVNEFEPDADRKKAKVTGSINISNLIPNGGRFSYNITHYNSEPGNEVLSFTSSQLFFDSPANQSSSNSTANINGTVTFDEGSNIVTRKFSGVAYYNIGSQFGVTVSGINLLNQISFPTDRQIQLTANNMLISSGGVNTNNMKGLGTDITGWTIDWNSTGLTFSTTMNVNSNGRLPGFPANTNVLNTTPNSNVKAEIFDYGIADDKTSDSKLMLFDSNATSNGTFNSNPVNGEGNRLSVTNLLGSGSLTFDSNVSLPGDELQYIFGRVIYPQHNFNNFFPSINTSVDYSSLSGSNKTFDTYTDLDNQISSNVTISGYRWYVTTPFGLNSDYNVGFSNGLFTFNSNFTENDLDYKPLEASPGNGDLVIMLGLDPGSNSDRPSKFIYLTGNYPGRFLTPTYNLSNSRIAFTIGQVTGVRKVWLLIGYKDNTDNTTRGKALILQNVSFSQLP